MHLLRDKLAIRPVTLGGVLLFVLLGCYAAWAAYRAQYFGDIDASLGLPYPDAMLSWFERSLDARYPVQDMLKVHGEWPLVHIAALGLACLFFAIAGVIAFVGLPACRDILRRMRTRAPESGNTSAT